ncbi:MAG TPA: formimidoylglutamase [Bacteroidales bacterium]|jgi:arginase family enzyme|nr:formimidoylglutamase [Bacteroidales bacterium]HNQ82698.1 formimidoylglutamase [Bacteroidales bacterium]HOX77137.1 formimidoylglutamase [Bacteroidales bacterium]HPI85863.1 formimidoylglutamase [Bacteroidales bacterium]HPM91268.1 formimidoylglutamase [Bacteroidales bacterium]
MDLSIYFEPVQLKGYHFSEKTRRKLMGDVVKAYIEPNDFPSLDHVDLAFIGVGEERNCFFNNGCGLGPDAIRKEFYKLYQGNFKLRMVDLGNVRQGHSIEDTYFAVTAIMAELLEHNIVPVILGGSQDITYAQYKAYEKIGRIINIASVDSQFDIGTGQEKLDSRSYMSHIILHQPNYLFNYTNIGFQTYFVDQQAITLMKNLYFDTYRLGIVRNNLEEVEPMVRNADMISVDMGAVRASDAPGNANATPNGFYGEEICQVMRYAGLSDKLTSIGIYELNPRLDRQSLTAQLAGQMIWYFIDGFYSRKGDFPPSKKKELVKFTVNMKDFKDEVVFYRSKKSERWWMEVPIRSKHRERYERHHLVPCSYQDYETACQNALPDRWWQTYQKLM